MDSNIKKLTRKEAYQILSNAKDYLHIAKLDIMDILNNYYDAKFQTGDGDRRLKGQYDELNIECLNEINGALCIIKDLMRQMR